MIYEPGVSKITHITKQASIVTIENYRDFSYALNTPEIEKWTSVTFDSTQLSDISLYVAPLEQECIAAHMFLSFNFTNGQQIGFSIEIRIRSGQEYIWYKGNRDLKLIYLWASTQDLLNRREFPYNQDVYHYPLDLSKKQRQDWLHACITETKLRENKPRDYSIWTANCTNELFRILNEHTDEHWAWHNGFIWTTYITNYLRSKGIITERWLHLLNYQRIAAHIIKKRV